MPAEETAEEKAEEKKTKKKKVGKPIGDPVGTGCPNKTTCPIVSEPDMHHHIKRVLLIGRLQNRTIICEGIFGY